MVSKQRSKETVCGAASSARLCPWGLLSFSRTLRAHLPLDINFRGCMKGFQFQKKDFNLLEQTETLGVGYGCPEDSLVSTIQPRAFSRVNRPLSTVRSTSSASLGSFLLPGERKLIKLERLVGLSRHLCSCASLQWMGHPRPQRLLGRWRSLGCKKWESWKPAAAGTREES